MTAQFSSASAVDAPRCGSAITRACAFTAGLGKSQAYQPRRLAFKAASTAASLTTPSREKFISTAPGRIRPRLSALTRSRVAAISGTCSETKSACLRTSATLAAFFTCAGRLQAASTVMCGSKPWTSMPSLMAASATRQPTLPRPTMPSVWPASSKPAKAFLPSSTACSMPAAAGSRAATKRSAGARLRAVSSIAASTSSLTALAFAPGALKTGTPRALIALTGMLLVPAPARAMASTLAGISIACMSADRTSTASGAGMSLATR